MVDWAQSTNLLTIASVHSFFYTFLKSGIDESTKWSTIPACPSHKCFFNRADTDGTNKECAVCKSHPLLLSSDPLFPIVCHILHMTDLWMPVKSPQIVVAHGITIGCAQLIFGYPLLPQA